MSCDSFDRRRVWSGSSEPRGHSTEGVHTGGVLPFLSEAVYFDARRGDLRVFCWFAVELTAAAPREAGGAGEAETVWRP